MKLFDLIDRSIDRVTMYRLLLYYLLGILLLAMLLSAFGLLSFSPIAIGASAMLTVSVAYITNRIFAWVYQAPSNSLSAILTGLILALIISPPVSLKGVPFLLIASGLAIAAKYMLAINNKHIFNPAAIAVVVTAFASGDSASWWVGNTALVPLVVIGGLLVARKIRRFKMVGLFIAVALVSTVFFAALAGKAVNITLQPVLLHSSLFFLAFVMLTEPLTSPTTWRKQAWYAVLVGVLFAPDFQIFGFYFTPELALITGNLLSFAISPRVKTMIELKARTTYGINTQDISFVPERSFQYAPGQYVELTLPHARQDNRGVRRYFTLASSPTESELRFGIRYYNPSSSFKVALKEAPANLFASIGALGGDFTLPRDDTKKLAFIAGGIGVTPFRSMVKYLTDTNTVRDVVLLYGERSVEDVVYGDVFEAARKKIGIKTLYLFDQVAQYPFARTGRIDTALIQRDIPDYSERLFYISGPQPMVRTVRRTLIELGVKRHCIKTDYFSGYA